MLSTADAPQARCEHVALVHSGVDDLSRRLAPSLHRALAESAAVLICLDDEATARVRADFGSMTDSFTFAPSAERYARPGPAMAALHQFVSDALESDAPAAWAIGSIPMRGDGREGRWMRYEEAVAAVFADLPLRALCLYDAAATPVGFRDSVHRFHHAVDGDWYTHGDDDVEPMAHALIPTRPADLVVRPTSPRDARTAVGRLFAATESDDTLIDLRLVISELVTNAFLHGKPPTEIFLWKEAGTCVLQVRDAGTTPIDPYADLRRCAGGAHGGFGLWTVGQVAHDVLIAHDEHGSSVTAVLTVP